MKIRNKKEKMPRKMKKKYKKLMDFYEERRKEYISATACRGLPPIISLLVREKIIEMGYSPDDIEKIDCDPGFRNITVKLKGVIKTAGFTVQLRK